MKRPAKKMLLCVFTALLLAASMLFVACSDNPEPQKPEPGAESGVYYYDSTDGEYLFTLSDGDKFALDMGEGRKYSGTYSLKGEKLELSFATPVEDANISATYKQETVTLTFGTSTMRFIRKVEYKVTFDSNGGSAVAEQTVINGKTLNKPADPVKENSTFIWWYTDNNKFENPFAFGSRSVTAPLTLYARWAGMPTEKEYTVKFDLNYEDANNNIPAVTTIAGKLYITTPAPEREGYVFNGWYVSTAHSGDKLSYPVTENIIFEENTTVYACWSAVPTGSKLATPKVTVSANGVSWERVSSAAQYAYKITNPDNTVSQNGQGSTPSTSVEYNFDKPGEYKVEITAVHSNQANNSDTAVRYYTGKSLARVSRFTVTDGNVLTFDKVANATGYRITVVCGNTAHTHIDELISDIGEGDTVSYNFAGCPMIEGGIRFTVTAFATGYVSSISETFVFDRTLAAVEGLAFNAETSVLTWNAVDNAEQYEVRVANNAAVKVTGTEYSLKEFAAGEYTVSVKPVAFGYNSPAAATLEFEKVGKAAPANVKLEGTTLKWDKVGEEDNYTVLFNGEEISVNGATELDLAEKLTAVADGTECSVAVKVAGDGNAYSAALTGKKDALEGEISYANGRISWQPAFGATQYEISVNDGAAQTTPNAYFDLDIAAAGTYEITVKVSGAQNGISVSVVFRKVTLNVNGGNALDKTEIYLADGDKLQLPAEIVKDNYVFAGWYDSVSGPEGNGRKYESGEIFRGAQNIELYAYYTPKPFTVQFNLGDEGSGSIADATVYYNENFTLPVPTPQNSVMSFTGWYSAAGGTGTRYTDANGVGIGTWKYTDSDTVTLYAGWMNGAYNFELNQTGTGYKLTSGEKAGLLTELTVPEEYNGLPVLEVGDFRYGYNLKTVNIPNTVTYIAQTAFANCSKLTEINITDAGAETPTYISENGIVYLPADAQKGLTKSYYILPTAVTGEFTVDKEINNIAAGAFSSTSITSIIIHADVTYVAPEAFANCKKLETVTFRNPEQGAESKELTIGAKAFAKCDSLTTVNLSSRKIKDGLPLNRYTLGSLVGSSGSANKTVYDDIDGIKHTSVSPEITNAITDIFYTGYVKEEIATDGNKVTTVIKRAPNSLQNINVDAANPDYKSINGILYNKRGDTLLYCPEANAATGGTLNLPADVRTIANGAFMHNTAIKTVSVHALGVNIGEIAFYASAVENVTFAGSNTAQPVVLGEYAFRESNITDLTFAENSKVTEIGDGAFFDCKSLGNFTIPASVTKIGARAFVDCKSLTEFAYAERGAKPEIGVYPFYGSALTVYPVLADETVLPDFEGIDNLQKIEIAAGNPNFATDSDGAVFNADKTVLLYTPIGMSGANGVYTLPDTVTEIANNAFRKNTQLNKVIIGANVTKIGQSVFAESNISAVEFLSGGNATTLSIGYRAFALSKITEIVLPLRTNSIDSQAFAEMPELTRLVFNEGLEHLGHVDNETLYPDVSQIAMKNPKLANVVISSTLTTIGAETFMMSGVEAETGLTVTFSGNSSLSIIEGGAFRNAGLRNITIPKSVTKINAYAFIANVQLTTVNFEIGGTEALELTDGYSYDPNTGLKGNQFASCVNLTTVTLPSRLTVIGQNAFSGCSSLFSVEFEDAANSNLTTISKSAFYECGSLYSFTVTPKVDVNKIGSGAFRYCNNLIEIYNMTQVDIANNDACYYTSYLIRYAENIYNASEGNSNINSSDDFVFYSDSSSTVLLKYLGNSANVTLPAKYNGNSYTIASYAFVNNKNLTSVVVPDGVTEIGEKAFYGCEKLESVQLPATVTSIGNNAFGGCSLRVAHLPVSALSGIAKSGLETVVIVNGENLPADAFAGCEKLVSVTLPNTLKAIGARAFSGCTALKSISIPDSVEEIFDEAFFGCEMLEEAELPNGLVSFGSRVFDNCSALQFNEYNNAVYAGNASNPYIVLLRAKSVTIDTCTVNETTRIIAYGAFENCIKLTQISIPNSVVTLGKKVFFGCSGLKTVNLGTAISEIGEDVFAECSSLETANLENIEIIGDRAFNNCAKLKTVDLSSIKSIGVKSFVGCPIPLVNLSAELESLESNSFDAVTDITIDESNAKYMASGGGMWKKGDRPELLFILPGTTTLTLVENANISDGNKVLKGTSGDNCPIKVLIISAGVYLGDETLQNWKKENHTIYCLTDKSLADTWNKWWNWSGNFTVDDIVWNYVPPAQS